MKIAKSMLFYSTLALAMFTHARANAASHSAWLPFSSGEKSSIAAKSSGSSTTPIISSFSRGTKKLVSSPTSLLTSKKQTAVRQSGTTGLQVSNPKQAKPGFFKSLFQSEPPPPPKTIKEWMKLKKVQP